MGEKLIFMWSRDQCSAKREKKVTFLGRVRVWDRVRVWVNLTRWSRVLRDTAASQLNDISRSAGAFARLGS